MLGKQAIDTTKPQQKRAVLIQQRGILTKRSRALHQKLQYKAKGDRETMEGESVRSPSK